MSTVKDLFKPSGPALRERRSELRFPLRLPVVLLSSREREIFETRDIGFRGIFVACDRCPPVRSLLRLGMILPTTGTELVVHAVVTRVVPPGDPSGREPGMGLELFATDRNVRTLWSGLVCYAHDATGAVDDPRSGVRLADMALHSS